MAALQRQAEEAAPSCAPVCLAEPRPRDPGVAVIVAALDYCSAENKDCGGPLDTVRAILCDSDDRFAQVLSELSLPHAQLALNAVRTLAQCPDDQEDGMFLALLADIARDLDQRILAATDLATAAPCGKVQDGQGAGVAGWWDPEHVVEGSVNAPTETLGRLISTDGGVRRLTRDVFRAVAPKDARLTADACDTLGTFRLSQCWTRKSHYPGSDPQAQVLWARMDPEIQMLLADLDAELGARFAETGVECSVSTSIMGYDLAYVTSAVDLTIRLPRDLSCSTVRLFRLPAGTVCPNGIDIAVDCDDGHVTIQATRFNEPHTGNGLPGNGLPSDTLELLWEPYGVCIKSKRATAPDWLSGACAAALDCVVAECTNVERLSRAVDIWNSERDETAELESLLDDVLDLEGVEPEHADLYNTALEAIRASTDAL
jgi:hypothetical protein